MHLSGTTKVLGIFGDPIAHSLSPAMQNAAIEAAGFNAVFVPFHVKPQQLGAAVSAVRALDLLGVNVTVPHKEAVLPFLDEIDDNARLIGAVNTIVNRQGRLIGYNTDALGFLQSLESDLGFHPQGKSVVLLGAGGATRAAVVALAQAGVDRIVVGNRTAEKADNLVQEFIGHFSRVTFMATDLESVALQEAVAAADLLVNTTTIGLHGDNFSVPFVSLLPGGAAFYDMVYSSDLTPLQGDARQRGLKFADGRGMLAGQGEEAFRLWFEQTPPEAIMRQQLVK